ncbi:NADH-cytochrome b5 reductase 3-like [Haemaphysalis longicornis]
MRHRSLIAALAAVAVGVGAFSLALLLIRKVRGMFVRDVLLAEQGVWYAVRLQQSLPVTHNVRLFQFSLQGPKQRLGFRVGQHVLLQAQIGDLLVTRPYTPVSLRDHQGSFDLIVKIYPPGKKSPLGGVMSQFLDSLQPGDEVQVQGPFGDFVYEGRGLFKTVDGRPLPRADRLGLVAAGSGITPMLQLLRHMAADGDDQTSVMMIYVNTCRRDIIARQELRDYAKTLGKRFRLRHVLDRLSTHEGRMGFVDGPLTADIMMEHLPPPGPETLVLCCGPPGFIEDVCKPELKEIGHKRVIYY